ncbi:hypothetical protein KIN20_002703 [Parelaphostrongylus tenuis]|uniref:Uncharacterized protein n=1 Tax=Parelaphostrongylus tenuis TaxID=148309 RepID=A0AAD5QGX6_PARTN|nr:hypothetical protein KIN20_002703 [Parelaphostrongylus tenuis]
MLEEREPRRCMLVSMLPGKDETQGYTVDLVPPSSPVPPKCDESTLQREVERCPEERRVFGTLLPHCRSQLPELFPVDGGTDCLHTVEQFPKTVPRQFQKTKDTIMRAWKLGFG